MKGTKKRTSTQISSLLSDHVTELAAFLRCSENSFVNSCVQSCIEAIYAPYDCKPTHFISQVRKLADRSTSETPLFRELTKELFSGLTRNQAVYLRRLLETSLGSGIALDSSIITSLKKIAKSSSPTAQSPESEEAESDWDSTWNHPFPPNISATRRQLDIEKTSK